MPRMSRATSRARLRKPSASRTRAMAAAMLPGSWSDKTATPAAAQAAAIRVWLGAPLLTINSGTPAARTANTVPAPQRMSRVPWNFGWRPVDH